MVKASVFNGNRCLICKQVHDFDIIIGEPARLIYDVNHTDILILSTQWNDK